MNRANKRAASYEHRPTGEPAKERREKKNIIKSHLHCFHLFYWTTLFLALKHFPYTLSRQHSLTRWILYKLVYIVSGMGNVTTRCWRAMAGKRQKANGNEENILGGARRWIPARIQRSIHHGAWAVIQPYAQPHIIVDETICGGEGNGDWHLDRRWKQRYAVADFVVGGIADDIVKW